MFRGTFGSSYNHLTDLTDVPTSLTAPTCLLTSAGAPILSRWSPLPISPTATWPPTFPTSSTRYRPSYLPPSQQLWKGRYIFSSHELRLGRRPLPSPSAATCLIISPISPAALGTATSFLLTSCHQADDSPCFTCCYSPGDIFPSYCRQTFQHLVSCHPTADPTHLFAPDCVPLTTSTKLTIPCCLTTPTHLKAARTDTLHLC